MAVDVAAMDRDFPGTALPSSSITATRCPGYGRPIAPGFGGHFSCELPTM
jgi:hypothetical protein